MHSARVHWDTIREAARSCLAHRLRSALGGLAIAVAVGTIAVVVEGLDGFARYSRQTSARAFGSDTFLIARVVQGDLSRRELAARLERNQPIRRSDVRFLEKHAGRRLSYAPVVQRPGEVTSGGRKYENATIGGTTSTLFEVRDLGIGRGRFIARHEDERAAQVAFIGAEVADVLFPGLDPVGRRVRIARRSFEVIGVQARQGTAGGASLDRNVWMPLTAYERLFGAGESLQVFARTAGAETTAGAEGRAVATMRARRQLQADAADSFDLLTPEAARSFVERLSERIGAAAAPISLMALLAAIVVVANTTLVSVAQRTREIGVKRAVGATRSSVVVGVLAESTLLAMAGGITGLVAARLLLAAAAGTLGVPLPLQPSTIAWSLGAAGLSGIVAGWYPARLASRVDVIAALRVE